MESKLNKRELFFAAKVVELIRPALSNGMMPFNALSHLLTISKQDILNGVSILKNNFNLSEGQIEFVDFIKHVHSWHSGGFDYHTLWERMESLEGPLFVFVMVDDYNDQSNWQYLSINHQNLHTSNLNDRDIKMIQDEMKVSTSRRMKVTYLFPDKTDQYNEEFLLEIMTHIPSNENSSAVAQAKENLAKLFSIWDIDTFRADPSKNYQLVHELVSFPPDILRSASEQYSIEFELTESEFTYYQFLGRIWDMLELSEYEGTAASLKSMDTVLAVFRMNDTEDAEQYRATYGPICNLNKEIINDYLKSLEMENSDPSSKGDYTQYEIDLYNRFMREIENNNNQGLHYLFIHEEWGNNFGKPFFHVETILQS